MKLSLNSKMLVFLLFCTLCIGTHTRLSAQFIDIPDANFRAKLQTLYPACFGGVGGIQLNTTCTAVTSATTLDVSGFFGGPVAQKIADLTGIAAFTSLTNLSCYYNQLTSFPTLPSNLQRLECRSNLLTSFSVLPSSLTYLSCGSNQLTTLPTLPTGLTDLYCGNNPIVSLSALPTGLLNFECGVSNPSSATLTSLPALPLGLQRLTIFNTNLITLPALPATMTYLLFADNKMATSLPALPANLQSLQCNDNKLISLPTLPSTLEGLFCQGNQLTSLPAIPAGVRRLWCWDNKLTNIPTLSTGLIELRCMINQITTLPALPVSLGTLECYNNQLTSLPALPVSLGSLECFGNQLTSLPTLPVSLVRLRCENNLLDFVDLESISPKPNEYIANPQSYIISPATITLALGGTFSINGTVGGTLNVYEWYRNNTLIVGANSAIYTKTGFAASDFGLYRCEVTSTFVGAGTTTGIKVVSKNVAVTTPCPTLSFTNTIAPNAVVGASYSFSVVVTGNTAPLTYSLSGVNGLYIDSSNGQVSGPIYRSGQQSYTVTATQNNGACSISQVYTFVATCPNIAFTNLTAPNGLVATPYTFNAVAPGADTYRISPTTLPAGLSFSIDDGTIFGTPTTVTASASYTVTAFAGNCASITRTYTFGVVCPTITFTNTTAPGGVAGTPYSFSAGASGANTYTINPTTLPAGLFFNTSTGLISGIPSAATASASYTVTASAGACPNVTQVYTFGVICPIITFTNTTAPGGIVGTPYSFSAGASGAGTYTISPTTLPAGLFFNTSTGLISGTPSAATASASYTVTASRGACPNATQIYTFGVVCPTITFTNTTAPSGVVGTPYSFSAGASGAGTYTISPTTLPAGLFFNISTGLISGTPSVATASASYTVTASRGICPNATQIYTFAINCAGFSITPATLPNGTATLVYNQPLTTNLTGTLTWSVTPALPVGISLSNTGVIAGTTNAVSASTAYTVAVGNGTCNTSQVYNIAFAPACTAVVLSATALPDAIVGTAYSQTITATGGAVGATYAFSTTTPLPAGFTLSSAGVLAGTPSATTTTTVTATFTVTATTTPNSCVGTSVYTLTIVQNPTTALDNSLANLVKVSPNPSSGDFNIDFGVINMAKSSVRVYDAQGKTVFSAENNKNLMVISLEKFASGIYLLEVETSKGRILKRLAKQ